MALALQQLINGLTLGAVYGLIAIGYTMVYGIIGMINFAHGDIYMVSAFIAVTAFTLLAALGISSVPLALLVVLLVAVLFTAVYGWTVERTAYRPLRGSTRLDYRTQSATPWRRVQVPSVSRLALPPAAVVLMVSVRSVAKRAR